MELTRPSIVSPDFQPLANSLRSQNSFAEYKKGVKGQIYWDCLVEEGEEETGSTEEDGEGTKEEGNSNSAEEEEADQDVKS